MNEHKLVVDPDLLFVFFLFFFLILDYISHRILILEIENRKKSQVMTRLVQSPESHRTKILCLNQICLNVQYIRHLVIFWGWNCSTILLLHHLKIRKSSSSVDSPL